MPVNIRELAEDDLDTVLALNNANVPEVNELDRAELDRLVAISRRSLVAEVDGMFAGYCVVFAPGADYASVNYAWFSRSYDDFAYLDRIAVTPAARRHGVGRAMYRALVDEFTGQYARLCCEVNLRPLNQRSLDFHHQIGFREVGQQDTDGGSKTVSLLALDLHG